jgi:hypothetical protein
LNPTLLPARPTTNRDVCEAIIDNTLCDRLQIDKEFSHFVFSRAINRPASDISGVVCKNARCHAWRVNGETDIEVVFEDEGGKCSYEVLIENKICSPFQPMQIERYIEHSGRSSISHTSSHVIVMAPNAYFDRQFCFDKHTKVIRLPYEDLRNWMRANSAADANRLLIADLLQRGIEKSNDARNHSAYVVSHAPTESLYEAMFRICKEDFLLPPLKAAKARSAGSYELCFDLPGSQELVISDKSTKYFSLNYRFDRPQKGTKNKMIRGKSADIQIEFRNLGWGDESFKISDRLKPILPLYLHSETRGGLSLYLVRSHQVPRLNRELPLNLQRVEFDQALILLRELFAWYVENYKNLVDIAKSVKHEGGVGSGH